MSPEVQESIQLTRDEFDRIPFSVYAYPLDLPNDTTEWRCKIKGVWWIGNLADGKTTINPVLIVGEENEPIHNTKRIKNKGPLQVPRTDFVIEVPYKEPVSISSIANRCYRAIVFEVAKYNLECDLGQETTFEQVMMLIMNKSKQ